MQRVDSPERAQADADSPPAPGPAEHSSPEAGSWGMPSSDGGRPSGAAALEPDGAVIETGNATPVQEEEVAAETELDKGVTREDKLDRFSCHIW